MVLFTGFFSHAQDERKVAMKRLNDLAGPEFHGRGYVQDGLEKAGDYIFEIFEQGGLAPTKQAFIHSVNTFPDSMAVYIDGKRLQTGVDFIPDPNCGSAKGAFGLIWFTKDDLTNLKLQRRIFKPNNDERNAVLLDMRGITNRDSIMEFRGLAYAFAEKVPVIIRSSEKFTWSVGYKQYHHPILEVRDSLIPEGLDSIRLNVNNEFVREFESENIIAVVPGKKKNKFILVTAHYDHLGGMGDNVYVPGANDNASGVTMMLSLFDHYSRNYPKYTMVFIAFAGEEAGLVGSKYYTQNPTVPLGKIEFVLNLDLLGTGDDGITVVNASLHGKEFDRLKAINERNDYLPKVKPRGEAANSDHYFFTKKGVPAFFIYTLGGITAYHDVNDRPETLPLTEFTDIRKMLIEFLDGF